MTGINPYSPDANQPADPGLHPLAGNRVDDDDGVALDEQFEGGGWQPYDYQGVNYTEDDITPVTRLITSRVTVGNAGISTDANGVANNTPYNPVILMPADKTRENVQITCTANAVVFIAATRNLVMSSATAFQLPASGSPLTLDSHTGPIVVWSPDTAAVVVQAVAVCK